MQILADLMSLRQLCCDPSLCYSNYKGGSAKLETCMELLQNGTAAGHKILLFSQFTSMLSIIEKRLKKEKLDYYMLTGATRPRRGCRWRQPFKRDQVPIFLISLKAGGTGLNLEAADMVILYDPWWNAAAESQAADRAHRIGQENQVTVFKLITKHTIEENILKLQEQSGCWRILLSPEREAPLRGSRRKSFLRCCENNSVRIIPGKSFCEGSFRGDFLQAWMCPRFAPKSKEKRKVLEERSCYNAEWTGITVRKDKGGRIKEMKKRIRILTLALAFSLMTSQTAQAALISPLSVGQTGGPGVTENQQSSNAQTGGQTGNVSPDFRGTSSCLGRTRI